MVINPRGEKYVEAKLGDAIVRTDRGRDGAWLELRKKKENYTTEKGVDFRDRSP